MPASHAYSKFTLSDFINGQDQTRTQGGYGCSVVEQESIYEIVKEPVPEEMKKNLTRTSAVMNVLYVTKKFRVMSASGGTHTVVIRGQADPDGILGFGNKIQVFCDCPDFIYRSAYILNQANNLFRSTATDVTLGPALGTAPKRAVTGGASVCKHCCAVFNYLAGGPIA